MVDNETIVTAKYPDAKWFRPKTGEGHIKIVNPRGRHVLSIGQGKTEAEAWADAAMRIS